MPPWEGIGSGRGQDTWGQLVGILRTLCRPGGDWPDKLPQTPDHLLPYLGEEAEELLNALRQGPIATVMSADRRCPRGASPRSGDHRPDCPDRLLPCRDLLPWILWTLAASDYDTMGWLCVWLWI